LLAVETEPAAATAPAAGQQAEILPVVAGSDAAFSANATADLTAAYIDAHSQGWQLVMRELMTWVQHKQDKLQQQQQQRHDQLDVTMGCTGELHSPQQVGVAFLGDLAAL
jgi:hypothetical protein